MHWTGISPFFENYSLHFRGWLGYAFAMMLLFIVVFMVLTRFCGQGKPVDDVKVIAPPALNKMEQLLVVQNAISQTEGLVQDGNIVLLKIRGLLLCIFPQVCLSSFATNSLYTIFLIASSDPLITAAEFWGDILYCGLLTSIVL